MRKTIIMMGMLLLFIIPFSLAEPQKNKMKLLAVQEFQGNLTGSEADLFVELKEGESRVFLETFPLTKMDTQISTRFAKDIACSYFNLDCENQDFIYTIKAETNIIGGPSAGAAIAALTAITLLDLEFRDDITITGTINSGGVIGPVGGLKEKLQAAADNYLKTVLVAQGTLIQEEGNETINLKEFGEKLGLEVIEVADLNQVVSHMTGTLLKESDGIVPINEKYQEIMSGLQKVLCNRTEELRGKVSDFELTEDEKNQMENWTNQSWTAIGEQNYYAAASFCFGANVYLKGLWYDKEQLSTEEMNEKVKNIQKNIVRVEEQLHQEEIKTIADLQTSIIVKERLTDSRGQLEKYNETENNNQLVAYSEERLFSALSWMTFFTMPGKEFIFNDQVLEESCRKKIAESEERYQYLTLILGGLFERQDILEKIDRAKDSLDSGEFDLCLIQASEAKGDANLILSSVNVPKDNLDLFVETKLKAAENVIAENSAEGIFPLIGYSYLKYALALKDTEQYSALLFSEYALELSDMKMYFKEESKEHVEFKRPSPYGEGFATGVALTVIVFFILKSTSGKKKIKRKK